MRSESGVAGERGHPVGAPARAGPGDELPAPDPASDPLPTLAEDEAFRLIVGSVVDYAIFMIEADGRVATWNQGAERLKQYRQSEIIGRHFSVFYTPEDRAAGRPEQLLEAAAEHGRVEDEGWRVRKDGSRFWADVVITALRAPDGRLRGFAKVTRDLTERHTAEAALRHSEERLRLIVEGVIDYAIVMLDPYGNVSTWNAGARRLTQYRAEEIIGRHFSAFHPRDDRAGGRPERLLVEAAAGGRAHDEGWRIRKDGSRFWGEVVITALCGADGDLRGFSKVTHDLTERRQAEEALREVAARERDAATQLREANRSRQNLVATVAHDLRAPVGVLHGVTDMLLRDWERLGDTDRVQMLRMMRATSSRLQALVDDVLDMARIEAGQLRYDMRVIDLDDVVARAAADIDPGGARVLVAPATERPRVLADERRLWQVITNLMGNAMKFSPPEESVGVAVEVAGGRVRVSVSDRGPGIAETDVDRVFEPFTRIRAESGGIATPGTGLGLHIARSLVLAHGGDIEVSSEPGQGSTFHFSLPLV